MFSRITIVEFFSILSSWTHAKIDWLLLKYGLETIAPAPQRSTLARATLLMEHLINHPSDLGPMGSNLTLELIEEVLEFQVPGCLMGFEEAFPKATRSLKRDGFTIDGTKLRSVLPETISLPAADDEVHALLREFTFTIPAGHLDQAIQAHTRGDWAAANSQLRTFVEALFDSIAHKLAPTEAGSLTSSHSRRELLASLTPPFLLSDLNEWEIGGAGSGFIQGFWKRLHPAGSHPGLSDEDDCTFRLHVVLLVTAMLLRRLKSRLVSP